MEKDIVELIKERVRIEDVIKDDGYPLPTRGRYRKCTAAHSGGLVVDVQRQRYFWVIRAENGDVIQWVINQRTHDFKAACEELARRYGLPDPDWGKQDAVQRIAARTRENALQVASQVLHRWFWANESVQEYVKGRGFSAYREFGDDEAPSTAHLAQLGYSGSNSETERREMIDALRLNGVDLESPVAIAILGYQGDVKGWSKAYEVEDINEEWVKKKRIPGLMDYPRLCYPHIEHGQVRYISTRSIGEKFHYNLPDCLVGKRRMYFNHQWNTTTTQAVVCEGQADAITWGQWGIPAVALAGVTPDDDLAEILKPYQTVYVAIDMDITGVTSAWRLAMNLGPRTRLIPARNPDGCTFSVSADAQPKQKEMCEWANENLTALAAILRWPLPERFGLFLVDGVKKEVKDSNDILRSFYSHDLDAGEHESQALLLLDRAPSVAEAISSWAGAKDGAARDSAMKTAAGLINKLDDFSLAQQKGRLAKLLQIGMRELERMLKAEKALSQKAGRGGESVYTWGGYVNGWLLEYLYDAGEHASRLAWRDPDGKIDSGPGVQIDGTWYEAFPPDDMFRQGSVYYPSELGEKKTIRELLVYLRMYLNSIYIMPNEKLTRLVAYWILQTYLYDAFQSTIYLRTIGSAGAGKSEFLFRVGLACYRMMMASGTDSMSSLFRSVNRYRGTVIIDEADMQMSDTENEMIKFYNQGAFKGRPIMRTREVTGPDGEKTWEAVAFQVFCPKLIGARKDFRDDAVGSRSLTLKLVAREPAELIAAKVPLVVTKEILERGQALRNLLIRFRLENWQPEITIDPNWYDLTISARLNQVAGPLLAIAREDPEQQEEIRFVLREYYAETILNRSMTKEARVLEALWKIWNYPDLHESMVKVDEEGNAMIRTGDIARITNEIIDLMNETGSDEDETEDGDDKPWKKDFKKDRKKITPRSIGHIVREEFQLAVSERKRDGFWVFWNQPRMEGLSTKYGIHPEDFGPKKETVAAAAPAPAKPTQGALEGVS